MLSTHRATWLAAIALVAAFGAINTLSNGSTPKVATTFEGSVAHQSVTAHSFTVERPGAVEVRLTGLRPAPTTKIGLGLGTPTSAGNCALAEADDSTQVNGSITGKLRKGTYCVAIYDSGAIADEPIDYTVSVTEE